MVPQGTTQSAAPSGPTPYAETNHYSVPFNLFPALSAQAPEYSLGPLLLLTLDFIQYTTSLILQI